MASERQIAANRRNARRSTGPRSSTGKKRAGRNAYRHGLSLNSGSIRDLAESVNNLARKIAGDSTDTGVLERARMIAEAEFDLCRARRAKVELIEPLRGRGPGGGRGPVDAAGFQEPGKVAEAGRRVMPVLLKLDRYERRALGRRDRAIRDLSLLMMALP